jgi:hypothetical protein
MWQHDSWVWAVAWQLEWAIPAAGVAAAAVAFSVGRSLVRGRRRQRAGSTSEERQQTGNAAGVQVCDAQGQEKDPYSFGSATEQRGAVRRSGNAVGVQVRNPEDKGPEQPGWVVDRSVGGLCLQMDSPLKPGTTWQVRPRNAPSGAPWVAVLVRNCAEEGDTWKIGCQFVKTPTWNIRMLFG